MAAKRRYRSSLKAELLAFVLCDEQSRRLTAKGLTAAWKKFGTRLALKIDEGRAGLTINFGPYRAFVVDGPFRIPNAEAESVERFSVAGLWQYDPPRPHSKHLIVNMVALQPAKGVEQLEEFCSLLAALISTVKGTGVYWGNAQATHPADLVLDVVKNGTPRSVLWSGVSYARVPKPPGLVSFLSRGLYQLGLKEIEVQVPVEIREEGLDCLLNLAEYTAQRGADIPDRDTYGREPGEQIVVRHTKDPLKPSAKVVQIRLPAAPRANR